MQLHTEEVDAILAHFPEVNTFIEKYQRTTTYGKSTRISVTIGQRFPKEVSQFTFRFILPVIIISDSERKQVYNVECPRTALYQELINEEFSDFIIRVMEDEVIEEFKKLMISCTEINNVVLTVNKLPVYFEDEI